MRESTGLHHGAGHGGGQPRYSDLAITMCLTLGMVYRLPLRQTKG